MQALVAGDLAAFFAHEAEARAGPATGRRSGVWRP